MCPGVKTFSEDAKTVVAVAGPRTSRLYTNSREHNNRGLGGWNFVSKGVLKLVFFVPAHAVVYGAKVPAFLQDTYMVGKGWHNSKSFCSLLAVGITS